jgi:CheY-like chemotaxis protein
MSPEDTETVDVLLFAVTGDEALVDAFDRADRFDLTVVNDADAALDRMRSGEFPPPQLLLMEFEGDGEGMKLLQTVKDDEKLRRIPVITISDSPTACERSYAEQANAHVERPSDPDGFDEAVDRIESFWVRAATLPPLTNDS